MLHRNVKGKGILLRLTRNFDSSTRVIEEPFTTFQNKTWKYHDPTKDPQTTLDFFDETMGLWVEVNKSLELSLECPPFESAKINLSKGWNLIGYPYLENKNVTDVFGNNTVYSYDGSWFSYISGRVFNSLQVLKLGYGYWVNVK